jgi:hypothetical protein
MREGHLVVYGTVEPYGGCVVQLEDAAAVQLVRKDLETEVHGRFAAREVRVAAGQNARFEVSFEQPLPNAKVQARVRMRQMTDPARGPAWTGETTIGASCTQ